MSTIDLDIESFTIEELELFEEHAGIPFDEIGGRGKPKAKTMRVLVWLIKRRENPEFTLEEAGKLRFTVVKTDPKEENG